MNKKAIKKDIAQPVIVITGAGKGIGRALVTELCHQTTIRPRLVLISRTLKDLKEAQSECAASGRETSIYKLDISNTTEVDLVLSKIIKTHGRVDGLINNAGVGRFGDIETLTLKDFDFVMNTNARGTFYLTQKVFAVMKKQKSGHIVFVTSVAAEKAFEQSAIYCMSKFAQKGLIEVLRLYGRKHGIRITNVLPGAVETPMWGKVSSQQSKRMMQPRDIAQAIACALIQPTRTSIEEIVIRPIAGDL